VAAAVGHGIVNRTRMPRHVAGHLPKEAEHTDCPTFAHHAGRRCHAAGNVPLISRLSAVDSMNSSAGHASAARWP
jgi:hypothetical protein